MTNKPIVKMNISHGVVRARLESENFELLKEIANEIDRIVGEYYPNIVG